MPNYNDIYKLYGKTHHIRKRMGTNVDLTKLPLNQAVCWGDGETFIWLLTKKTGNPLDKEINPVYEPNTKSDNKPQTQNNCKKYEYNK